MEMGIEKFQLWQYEKLTLFLNALEDKQYDWVESISQENVGPTVAWVITIVYWNMPEPVVLEAVEAPQATIEVEPAPTGVD